MRRVWLERNIKLAEMAVAGVGRGTADQVLAAVRSEHPRPTQAGSTSTLSNHILPFAEKMHLSCAEFSSARVLHHVLLFQHRGRAKPPFVGGIRPISGEILRH